MAEFLPLHECQKAQLSYLLQSDSDVFLYGPSGSGKSTLAQEVLKSSGLKTIWMSCSVLLEVKTMMRYIVCSYEEKTSGRMNLKCFYTALMGMKEEKKREKRIIVLDHAEKIVGEDRTLPILLLMRTEAQLNVGFLFISEMYRKEAFRCVQFVHRDYFPVPVFVPQMTQPELCQLMCQRHSHPVSELQLFLNIVKPIISMYSEHINVYDLAVEALYTDFEHEGFTPAFKERVKEFCSAVFQSAEQWRPELLEDVATKLLLVSAFICSHVHPKDDVNVFKALPTRVRKSRRREIDGCQGKVSYQRVIAVFQLLYHSITGRHWTDFIALQTSLCTLLTHHQLELGSKVLSPTCSLRSCLTREDAEVLSTSLGLKLADYISLIS